MIDERAGLIYLLNVFYANPQEFPRIGEDDENITMMKRIIELNPQLNENERNLLSCLYKTIVTKRRDVLRRFENEFNPECQQFEKRYEKIQEFRETLVSEVDKYCLDLCQLIEDHLLPVASTPESRIFYEKMEADYYRYMAENHEGDERQDAIQKAGQHYENALSISKSEISSVSSLALGLVLNYSVFLYDMMEKHHEAIELSEKSVQETIDLLDTLSDKSYTEASKIIMLLKDNCQNWRERL
ncbi:14-3-3 protein [Trichomonas vaginalis G3]|uniref:14-3-3 protein n=1 Tax=Trichomonas vaginalis (strain ATCC PRA-98 / G3) TaxID=412133 RepID=A2DN94_TRIV3|nr:protein domain specific binding [Trichomonas vaginalis G3]EAY18082.1 14-3-3 protein [Trichomonas vaginalis G3]KAI5492357.1 protein domain specific binding [Trichomonas vaginalis G3]|eukprot:XP_001579068.1 14-3-3 protein [Trichomonas vaginalis G3]